MPDSTPTPSKIVLPLGHAILEIVRLELARREGLDAVPGEFLRQRDLIIDALDKTDVVIGFDCDADGVADTPVESASEAVKAAATEGCCRLFIGGDTSRTKKSSSRSGSSSPSRRKSPSSKTKKAKK